MKNLIAKYWKPHKGNMQLVYFINENEKAYLRNYLLQTIEEDLRVSAFNLHKNWSDFGIAFGSNFADHRNDCTNWFSFRMVSICVKFGWWFFNLVFGMVGQMWSRIWWQQFKEGRLCKSSELCWLFIMSSSCCARKGWWEIETNFSR